MNFWGDDSQNAEKILENLCQVSNTYWSSSFPILKLLHDIWVTRVRCCVLVQSNLVFSFCRAGCSSTGTLVTHPPKTVQPGPRIYCLPQPLYAVVTPMVPSHFPSFYKISSPYLHNSAFRCSYIYNQSICLSQTLIVGIEMEVGTKIQIQCVPHSS